MSTTVEDVLAFQHKHLKRLTHKIVYLAIRNRQTDKEWASLSLTDLRTLTGLTPSALVAVVRKLVALGLIEKTRDGLNRNDKTRYRTTDT
ncbi:MarR family transcriptional regulator [Luteibacter sp. CQ10]|uniref:MarR family transcriptional regulator n=1 Tax=Luteibacter sp. CQ10 TaxID=2805821 RepID=UPI0034A0EC58